MTPLQIIFDFFKELINRIGTKSPKFFKVMTVFAASLTFAGYFPSMLQRWFGFEVSGNIITLCEDVAKYSIGALAMSGLTVSPTTVGKTEEGSIVKVTDEKKLPFTAAAEQKEAAKEVPPPEVIPEVPEPDKIDTSKFPYQAPNDTEQNQK